ncbi:MAG: polyprenyl synthetase family protein, partial [Casimicrobiaceae bacterium]
AIGTHLCQPLARLDARLAEALASDVPLVNTIASYIVNAGGKRLRPILTLLACEALGGDRESDLTISLAAVIELIHTATLLHDDVVDESDLRRGRATANAAFGNAASVLVGDFLYSRAFQLMVATERPRVLDILAEATNRIAEGEVMQLMAIGRLDLSVAEYMRVIDAKTAKLFEAAGALGAIAAGAGEDELRTVADYARHLGAAFQIADDVLDYRGDADALGKRLGDDLAEGKLTLPIIIALERADPPTQSHLRGILSRNRERHALHDASALPDVLRQLEACGALDASLEHAATEAQHAHRLASALPPTKARDWMLQLTTYAICRHH